MSICHWGDIAVAQGGGPTPVINSSLYGIVDEVSRRLPGDARIWGLRGGITGVFREDWRDLRRPPGIWQALAQTPGAALGSCRKRLNDAEAASAAEILLRRGVRAFFYIGGNDSMDTALRMSRAATGTGLRVAGIPKTIDNDLPQTDHCPGFGSAARYIAQSAVDLGSDVRSLPTPVSLLEVMGRNAGWLAAATLAARREPEDAPHLIYVPEIPLSAERFLADIEAVYDRLGWVVAAVSEGVRDEDSRLWSTPKDPGTVDDFGHPLAGDAAAVLAQLVTRRLGLRARSEKPGLCGRSSALLVSPVDRAEAEAVGREAVRRVADGGHGFMVTIRRDPDPGAYAVTYGAVSLEEVANVERPLDPQYLVGRNGLIDESYLAYLVPLMGGPLTHYPRLE